MKVQFFLLLLAVPSIFYNLGTLALQRYNPTISSIGEALAWVLLPSQCANILLDLSAELIQVGWLVLFYSQVVHCVCVCFKTICLFQQMNHGNQGSTFIITDSSGSGMTENLGTRQWCIVGISYYNEVKQFMVPPSMSVYIFFK